MTLSRVLPFSALYRFIKIASTNGGIHYSKLHRLAPYVARCVLFEPFSWIESVALERKIQKNEIEHPPLFVLGHWRSGTTFMQRLLSQDTRFAYLNIYKAIFPQMYFSTEKSFTPFFQSVVNMIGAKNPFHRIRINWELAAEEDDTALLGLLSPHTPYWGFVFPKNFKRVMQKYAFQNLSDKDILKWKEDYMYLAKKLSLHYSNKPLILRSPPNTTRIKQLLELFPNAKFVYVHRNPYEVFCSNRGLWKAHMRNFSLQKLSPEKIDENILFAYKLLLTSYLGNRDLIPKQNLIEVRYEELFNDPIQKMKTIYDHLNLPPFENIKPKLEVFVNKHKFAEPTRYEFTPEIIEKVNTNWEFSLNEWKYDPELELV